MPRSSTRHALTLMIGTLASRLSGLVRASLLLQLFPQAATDAFNVAWKIPNLFRELLAEGALTNSFIPIYKALPREEGRRLAGALFAALALLNALLLGLAIWAAPWLVGLLLQPDSVVDFALAVQLTRIIFPVLAAISLSALAMGILNAEERFFAPAWAPVALNLVVIAVMLLYPGQAPILALGVVLGGLAQLLVQLPALLRGRLLPVLSGLWHPSLGLVLLLMAPFALTTGARQVLNLLATNLLSGLPGGSITAFENANLLFSLALGLFSISPALAYYSRLSGEATAPERFLATLTSGVRLITFLTVPAGLLMFLLAAPAVNAIWNLSPAAGQEQTILFTIWAVAPLGLAVFPWGVNNLLLRPFYIRQRVRTPIIISLSFVALNGLLFVLLAPRYGLTGMAWASVAVGWLQLLVLLYWLRRTEGFSPSAFAAHAGRVWAAAMPAAGAAWALVAWLPWPVGWLGWAMQVGVGGVVAGLVYAGLALALKIPEMTVSARWWRR
ncbi:MAG: murein biosynthesis integral membrane protein MurJ [Truepera sp.]|nr:murein biosynthesis integral membrane protein MurJ [Truepera sp.]